MSEIRIVFNQPTFVSNARKYLNQVILNKKFSGDGYFGKKCQEWLESNLKCRKVLLTPSCTSSLELAALLLDIKEGDEVIMASYTFTSTANAFVLRGAKLVFVDINLALNIDEDIIEGAISNKTKAIVVMHYGSVACNMNVIMDIARKHKIPVIEDAAQCLLANYKGQALGTIGDIGCLSFHETKNYQCGEGGAILINNPDLIERAEIIREKGTDRSKFLRGQVDKYSWVDVGSSYLLSELNAAYLYAQLEVADEIKKDRMKSWELYFKHLYSNTNCHYELPYVPNDCDINGHLFYLVIRAGIEYRDRLIKYLKYRGIISVFHYVPLHSSKAGIKYGNFFGRDRNTTSISESLIRLPLYYKMGRDNVMDVINNVKEWFEKEYDKI